MINRANAAIFLTAFHLLLAPLLLPAQEVDHVYLKNGSLIRGNIIEIAPEEHVKVQDLCGNIWQYDVKEVEKITAEPFDSSRDPLQESGFHGGYVNMTSIGFLAGSPANPQPAPFSVLSVNGWRGGFGLFMGGGIGVEFLNTSHMPLFLDLRYDLIGGNVVPYITVKGGYSLPLTPEHAEYEVIYDYNGGPLVGGGIGLKIRTRNHFAWDIGLLYRYQEISYSEFYDYNEMKYSYTDIYNRIEIRLGFYID